MSYYIEQIGENDCGIASLKMLLAILYKNKDFLYYPQKERNISYNYKELMQIASKEGVNLGVSKVVDKNDIFTYKTKNPFLISIKVENSLHLVLVKKIKRNKLLIYDPKNGIYWLKKEELINIWNGDIIEANEIRGSTFKANKINVYPKSFMFLTMIFEMLSFLALFMAMFFVDKDFSFLIPLILFAVYIIFEFIYQKIIVLALKYFDNTILYRNYLDNRNNFKEYYLEMNNYKTLIISTPINFIASLMLIIFGLIILGMNNYLNVIILIIVFAIQIGFRLFDKKYLNRKRSNLKNIEKNLFNNKQLTEQEFKENISNLNDGTYNFVTYVNFKKYFLVFITIALCLIYLGITGFVSLNFLLFHFFTYIFLQDQFDKILDLQKGFEKIKTYKCLYLYYFK